MKSLGRTVESFYDINARSDFPFSLLMVTAYVNGRKVACIRCTEGEFAQFHAMKFALRIKDDIRRL